MTRMQTRSRGRGQNKRVVKPTTYWKIATAASAAVAGIVGLFGHADKAQAQLTWDPPPSSFGTGSYQSGNWDLVTANWTITSTGTNNVVWAQNDTATFGPVGSSGGAIVTVATNILTSGITFNASGYTINGSTNGTITTGAIFLDATAGQGTALNAPFITNQNATINSTVVGVGLGTAYTITQSGAGTLTFGNGALQYYYGGLTLNGGGVTLQGTNNTFVGNENAGQSTATPGALIINAGSTLDVQGNSALFGNLSNTSTAGGILTSSTNSGTPPTVNFVNTATSTFGGTISGNLNLTLNGSKSLSQILTGNSSFSGSVTLAGGTLDFASNGAAANITAIVNNGGTVLLDNTATDIPNRLGTTANLTLGNSGTSGAFTLLGNPNSLTSIQTFNNLTANSPGVTTITVTPGGTTGAANLTFNGNFVNTTFGSLVNFGGTSATFSGSTLLGSGPTGTAGVANIFLTNINGVAATSALSNNIIGGWATTGSGTNTAVASYGANGVQPLAAGNYTQGTNFNTVNNPAANLLFTATNTATPSALTSNVTLNTLTFNGTSLTSSWAMGAHTLTIASGLFLYTQPGDVGSIWTGGTMTAGTTSAPAQFILDLAGTGEAGLFLNGSIGNNTAGGAVTFVKAGVGTMATYNAPFATVFKYTGGTIIDGGVIDLDSKNFTATNNIGGTAVLLPGNITINNGGQLQIADPNQTNSSNNVTINSGGLFNGGFNGGATNTIGNLTLVNNGGAAAPVFSLSGGAASFAGASSVLIAGTSGVTVVNNSLSTTPILANGNDPGWLTINLNGQATTFNIGGSAPIGLLDNLNFQNGSILKTGPGEMIINMNAASGTTWTYSGIDIQQGAVQVNSTNGLGGAASLTTLDNNGAGAVGTLILASTVGGVQGNINFNGGTLAMTEVSTQGNGQGLAGNVGIGFNAANVATTNGGTVLLSDPSDPLYAHGISLSGAISGAGTLNVVGEPFATQNGTLPVLTITGGTNNSGFTGNLNIISYATVTSTPAAGFGDGIGSSNTISFNNGFLNINDNGSAAGLTSSTLPGYNNNLALNGPGVVTLNHSTAGTGNILPIHNVIFNTNTTLTVNSANSYAMQINGTVSGGGTLAGNSVVTVTGVVAPGDAPAILNITDTSFQFTNSGTYSPEINGGAGWQSSATTNAGINYDQLNVTGGLKINGSTLNVRMSNQSSLVAGDEYFLVNETAAPTGTPTNFATVEIDGSVVSSVGTDPTDGATEYNDPSNTQITYELDYEANITTGALTGGNDVVLDVVSVPEPSVLGLLGVGAMGLLARRRKRKQPPKDAG